MLEEEIQRLASESAKIKSEIAQLRTERKQLVNQPTPEVRTWKYWIIMGSLCILVISQIYRIFVYVLKYGDNLMCYSDAEMDSCAKKSD
jgi:hypothetical protein